MGNAELGGFCCCCAVAAAAALWTGNGGRPEKLRMLLAAMGDVSVLERSARRLDLVRCSMVCAFDGGGGGSVWGMRQYSSSA